MTLTLSGKLEGSGEAGTGAEAMKEGAEASLQKEQDSFMRTRRK
jgi:hypothetical protein